MPNPAAPIVNVVAHLPRVAAAQPYAPAIFAPEGPASSSMASCIWNAPVAGTTSCARFHANDVGSALRASVGGCRTWRGTWWTRCCRRFQSAVAVGTGLSSMGSARPPHRTRRAELPHRAPTSGPGVEPLGRPRMQDVSARQPAVRESGGPTPTRSVTLAPAPKRLVPVPDDLFAVLLDGRAIGRDRVVVQVSLHHATQPFALLLDGEVRSGEITAPCGVPCRHISSSAPSITPARSQRCTIRRSRLSPIRCSRNLAIQPWSMVSK